MTRIQWKRLDRPGFEDFELVRDDSGWVLRGHVEIEQSLIDYRIQVDTGWKTRRVEVDLGSRVIQVSVDDQQRWRTPDGKEIENLRGCVDVDLGFSPSTNTLPIRRLKIPIGGSENVRAAWLRYPQWRWEVLEQEYAHPSEGIYTYRSPSFSARLVVDSEGFVREYPGGWIATSDGC